MAAASAEVQTLLGAVRRALWRAQASAAVGLALWGSAGLMLLAAAVHLALLAVPVGAVLWALAGLWASLLAWATGRRPTDAACALWADRHLGGASAFSTWLELGQALPGVANAAVLRWLAQWAAARVPYSLRQLAERPPAARLARPLLCVLVCLPLATLVLTLPAPHSPPQAAAAPAAGTADGVLPAADAPQAAQLVSEIASALRAAQPDAAPSPAPAPARGQAGQTQSAGQGKADDGKAPLAANASAAPPAMQASAPALSAAPPADGAAETGTAPSPGTGAGREAGDSPDSRAAVGISKPLRGALAVQRSQLKDRRLAPEEQADMDRLGRYDDDLAPQARLALRSDAGLAAPPAATPPPVSQAHRLSPTESGYVQAWLKASALNR